MIQNNKPPKSTEGKATPASTSTIYGLRPVIEAIDSDAQIDRVLLQNGNVLLQKPPPLPP